MPLSAAEKATLQADAQAIVDAVNALTVDPDVNPLQAQLDAANAQIATLTADKAALAAELSDLRTKVQADVDALDAADAAEDAARAKLRSDLTP